MTLALAGRTKQKFLSGLRTEKSLLSDLCTPGSSSEGWPPVLAGPSVRCGGTAQGGWGGGAGLLIHSRCSGCFYEPSMMLDAGTQM